MQPEYAAMANVWQTWCIKRCSSRNVDHAHFQLLAKPRVEQRTGTSVFHHPAPWYRAALHSALDTQRQGMSCTWQTEVCHMHPAQASLQLHLISHRTVKHAQLRLRPKHAATAYDLQVHCNPT